MQAFFEWTAWKTTPQSPYGAFHLIFAGVGLLLCVLLARRLRDTGKSGNRTVFLICGLLLLLLEGYRQLFYCFVFGDGQYVWRVLPFRLSNMPMYLFLPAALLPKSRVKQSMYDFMTSYTLFAGIAALAEPSALLSEYVALTVASLLQRLLIVFIGLYLGFSRRGGRRLSDFPRAVLLFALFCAVSVGVELLLREVPFGPVQVSQIGPVGSSLPVFKTLLERFRWYVQTPVYLLSLTAGAFLAFFPFTRLRSRLLREQSVAA